jgi:uncharacterized membrane protein YqgA involved in biofilm formation
MIGSLINAVAIVLGAAFGFARKEPLSAVNQNFFKVALGAFTVYYGLRLTWIGLNGSFGQILLQLMVAVLAMMAGKQLGRLMRLQEWSNRLGRTARDRIAAPDPDPRRRFNDGFRTCAVLFCAAPLGMLGAVSEGLSNYVAPLILKGLMEGLAAMGFVRMFGWGVALSAVPVLALQGAITVMCEKGLGPWLSSLQLVNSVNATGGLLIFSVGLVIFELKKIELADYLPSLAVAPLLTWLLRLI